MKIYLTGGYGFVGKNLAKFFSNDDNHIVFQMGRSDVIETLPLFMPDIIINCAAEIYNPLHMFNSNIELTRQCLEYVKQNKIKMIQLGSSSELGKLSHSGAESDLINPNTMYAATKGAATLLCQGYAREYDLDITIARPYSLYGRYEKSHRFFPRLCSAFEKNEKFTITTGYHDWLYIDDFVAGIDWLINKASQPGEIYHFGTGIQSSNEEVVRCFERAYCKSIDITYVNDYKNQDSNIWICNTTKTTLAGFTRKYHLNDGIADYVAGEI